MSALLEPAYRARRLVVRHDLSRPTLALITEAALPSWRRGHTLDDPHISAVNEAIETLVLSGLAGDSEISQAIHDHRDTGADSWREALWRERLPLAAAAYKGETWREVLWRERLMVAARAADDAGDPGRAPTLAALAPVPPIPQRPPAAGRASSADDTAAV